MPAEALRRALARVVAACRRMSAAQADEQLSAERSQALLLACLTPAQRREFDRSRGFTVRGASGQRYRIGFGAVANIDALNERGELLYRLCAKPDDVPTPAVMLAQKLMLETREAEFLRIAVRHPLLVPLHTWQRSGQGGGRRLRTLWAP